MRPNQSAFMSNHTPLLTSHRRQSERTVRKIVTNLKALIWRQFFSFHFLLVLGPGRDLLPVDIPICQQNKHGHKNSSLNTPHFIFLSHNTMQWPHFMYFFKVSKGHIYPNISFYDTWSNLPLKCLKYLFWSPYKNILRACVGSGQGSNYSPPAINITTNPGSDVGTQPDNFIILIGSILAHSFNINIHSTSIKNYPGTKNYWLWLFVNYDLEWHVA